MRAPIEEHRILEVEETSYLDKPMVFAHPNDSVSSIASYPTFSQRSSSDSTNTSLSSVDDEAVVHVDEAHESGHDSLRTLLPAGHRYKASPPMRLQLPTRPLLLRRRGSSQPNSPTLTYPTPISIHLNNELVSPLSEGSFSDRRSTIASTDSPNQERTLSQLIEGLERLNAERGSTDISDDHSFHNVSVESGSTHDDDESLHTMSDTLETKTTSVHDIDSDETFSTAPRPSATTLESMVHVMASQETLTPPKNLKPKRSSNALPFEHEPPVRPPGLPLSDTQSPILNRHIQAPMAIKEVKKETPPRYSQIDPKRIPTPVSVSPINVHANANAPVMSPRPDKSSLSRSATLSSIPPRLTSINLPAARPLRRLSRGELLAEDRSSKQWDKAKISTDVQQFGQRMQWDKAQKAWQLVRDAESTPITRKQDLSRERACPQPVQVVAPKPGRRRCSMLSPGRLEWAFVDSSLANAGPNSPTTYRLCIAWRVLTGHNAFRHPFGLQEELKVFVLERTSKEFYDFYEGLMDRFQLEPRRHPWAKDHEIGPLALGSIEFMKKPEDYDPAPIYDTYTKQEERDRIAELEHWIQGFMKLKNTPMAHVLESEYIRRWMAPRKDRDCERIVEQWRKDGHGEFGNEEGFACALERLW
ncbi:hypothetical protein CPB86DRAFT_783482 [Serendipita vermifera]|nr:hypothetical protein CPB86DRAFT_783482 [Serendipita vermifera]